MEMDKVAVIPSQRLNKDYYWWSSTSLYIYLRIICMQDQDYRRLVYISLRIICMQDPLPILELFLFFHQIFKMLILFVLYFKNYKG